jgi:hypothetical protein
MKNGVWWRQLCVHIQVVLRRAVTVEVVARQVAYCSVSCAGTQWLVRCCSSSSATSDSGGVSCVHVQYSVFEECAGVLQLLVVAVR